MRNKQEYPKFMHHISRRARLVQSAAEQEMLGSEWAESPIVHGVVTHPSLEQIEEMEDQAEEEFDLSTMTKAQLIAFARKRDIAVNAGLKKDEILRVIEETLEARLG